MQCLMIVGAWSNKIPCTILTLKWKLPIETHQFCGINQRVLFVCLFVCFPLVFIAMSIITCCVLRSSCREWTRYVQGLWRYRQSPRGEAERNHHSNGSCGVPDWEQALRAHWLPGPRRLHQEHDYRYVGDVVHTCSMNMYGSCIHTNGLIQNFSLGGETSALEGGALIWDVCTCSSLKMG